MLPRRSVIVMLPCISVIIVLQRRSVIIMLPCRIVIVRVSI